MRKIDDFVSPIYRRNTYMRSQKVDPIQISFHDQPSPVIHNISRDSDPPPSIEEDRSLRNGDAEFPTTITATEFNKMMAIQATKLFKVIRYHSQNSFSVTSHVGV